MMLKLKLNSSTEGTEESCWGQEKNKGVTHMCTVSLLENPQNSTTGNGITGS